jgi:Tfp pilus assembly protein PilN
VRPINLLPPEVAEERRRRRRIGLLVVAAVAYVLLLVAGVFYWNTRVASARADVDRQREYNADLEAEVVSLAGAAVLQQEFEGKAALVREALANDVDWGALLNDLARLLPERVWLESFNGTVLRGEIPGTVGQVTFTGVGFGFPDVAEWLRTLGSGAFAGMTGPWVNTASESTVGEETVVNFTSTAVLSAGAVTDRAEDLIPEVP